MKLKPLDDRVVVKPEEAEEKTAGGIVLPDTAKEKPMMGKVIAVGEGKLLDNGKRIAPPSQGQIVLYGSTPAATSAKTSNTRSCAKVNPRHSRKVIPIPDDHASIRI